MRYKLSYMSIVNLYKFNIIMIITKIVIQITVIIIFCSNFVSLEAVNIERLAIVLLKFWFYFNRQSFL